MTLLADKIAQLKQEYPSLRKGSEEDGYIDLNSTEYEATIKQWAETQLAEQAEEELKIKAAEELAQKKAAAEAKLAALGLDSDDLKALGLA